MSVKQEQNEIGCTAVANTVSKEFFSRRFKVTVSAHNKLLGVK